MATSSDARSWRRSQTTGDEGDGSLGQRRTEWRYTIARSASTSVLGDDQASRPIATALESNHAVLAGVRAVHGRSGQPSPRPRP